MTTKESKQNLNRIRLVWACYSRILESGEHLSGSERIERLKHLAKNGNDVYLIAAQFDKKRFNPDNCPNLHLISFPIKFFPIFSTILYGLALFFFLPIYLFKIRPDVLICDQSEAAFLLWKPFLSKLLKIKFILDIRSTPVTSGKRAGLIYRSSVWVAKTFFDGMTIVTPLMRDEVCRTFDINPNFTGILSNGISETFLFSEKKVAEGIALKEILGFTSRFIIIYHGSFRLTGGLIESIKAIALLKDKYPDIILLLLGTSDKDFLNLLNQTINKNKVKNNVVLHGPVAFNKVPEFIAMSDLALVPLPNISFWRYQQPLKLLEYLAMNKTIIVSESPAHKIIISEGKNVIYISQVTPERIAEAVVFAYENKEKLSEWGKTGLDLVLQKYIWEKVNENLIDYVNKLNSRNQP